ILLAVGARALRRRALRLPGRGARVTTGLLAAFLAGILATEAVWAGRVLLAATEVSYRASDGRPRVAHHLHYNPAWITLDAAIDWVGRRAAPGDVMATVATHTAWVRTGVK